MSVEEIDNIALPGDPEEGEESPFRRRQRAVPVRRGRYAKLRRILRWAGFGVLVLLPVGYSGYRLALFGLTSPRFMLTSGDEIVVEGNHNVSRGEILNVLGFPTSGKLTRGVSIFRYPMDNRRKQLESIPWVKSATLTRAYPNHLAVSLVERTPIAFVNIEGQMRLVDAEGVLLDRPEKGSFDFPVLAGFSAGGGQEERVARLALFQQFSREITEDAATSGWMVSEVDLTDADDLRAVLVQGHETLSVHFGHENFRQRFQNFLSLLPEVRKSINKVDSIDLRYRNQIVVNPQTTETHSAGEPQPSR
ncbi:MAG: cell division protein FtsQ/DivIB [Terriglobia bacterium]